MTNEMIRKAKECKSTDELLALAKENGIEMTAEEAAEKLAALNNMGELSDDELENAAGGGVCGGAYDAMIKTPGGFEVGDLVQIYHGNFVYLESCSACGYGVYRVTAIEGKRVYVACAKCGKERSYPNGYNFEKVVAIM